MPEVIHWMSPGPIAPVAERIAVADLALADDRDRLDPTMRVVRESRLVIMGIRGFEMVEQQERVHVIELGRPDAAHEAHARAFDDRAGPDDPRHPARNFLGHVISSDAIYAAGAADGSNRPGPGPRGIIRPLRGVAQR